MLRKRLVGVVTVKDGWAVQSFGYGRWLPLGRPEILVENLDRWGADEILVQCIDRSARGLGPDLALLERISRRGLSTPLIYAGGIRNDEDGRAVVQAAADRICLDALLRDDGAAVERLSASLGAQALVAALPLSMDGDSLHWLDYRSGANEPLSDRAIALLRDGVVSEALLIDWRHEGLPGAFDERVLDAFPLRDVPLIAFGGLSDGAQLQRVMQRPRVVAAAIGNFLAYGEHAVQAYKQRLAGVAIRPANYRQAFAP